ncbi:DEAD/DEAH box helicase [Rhizobiaceae bacterium]|nr:DEAD/DEAH box helicase [Rhizobiaceae bacterium]
MTFDELGLTPKVLAAVSAAGYTQPTPIQEQSIPHVLQRRDVMGIAQTGTGKTASFVLPMLSLTERGRARARMPRTLILEPTRELAAQVENDFNKYGINHKLNVALLIGGVSFDEQMKKLDRGADVLIATPGRLLDLFERGRILMTGVEILVIDEADRMLDMGFIPDIERIVKMVPFTRQTLFFSATMPPVIEKLADQFLQNPVHVAVATAASTSKTIEQKLVKAPKKPEAKQDVLRDLIDNAVKLNNGIVFCNRKVDVASIYKFLYKKQYSVGSLHGDMAQSERTKTLQQFRNGEIKLLVASDVAARGLDIPDVSHVFNYDIPIHAEDYVHRIGRCGRAGRDGWAFTLVTPSDDKYLDAILSLTGDTIPYEDGSKPVAPATSHEQAPKRSAKPEQEETSAAEAAPTDDTPARPRRTRRAAPGLKQKAEVQETVSPPAVEPLDTSPVPARDPKPRRRTKAPVDEAIPAPAQATVEKPKPARPPRREKADADDNGPVRGFGSDVPAFLTQSVREKG